MDKQLRELKRKAASENFDELNSLKAYVNALERTKKLNKVKWDDYFGEELCNKWARVEGESCFCNKQKGHEGHCVSASENWVTNIIPNSPEWPWPGTHCQKSEKRCDWLISYDGVKDQQCVRRIDHKCNHQTMFKDKR